MVSEDYRNQIFPLDRRSHRGEKCRRYHFKVSRSQKEYSDILVLVLKTPTLDILFYVIPMREVAFNPQKRFYTIAFNPFSKRKSKYEKYKDCWELVLSNEMRFQKVQYENHFLQNLTTRIMAGKCDMAKRTQIDKDEIVNLIRINIERVRAFQDLIQEVRKWHDISAEDLLALYNMKDKREVYLWDLYQTHQRNLPKAVKTLIRKVVQKRIRAELEPTEKVVICKTRKKRRRT